MVRTMRQDLQVSRRALIGGGLAAGAAAMMPALLRPAGAQDAAMIEELVIDLVAEPATLDPALTYATDGWSIVHSLYDSLVQFAPDGSVVGLLAELVEYPDPLLCRITLREGRTFHDGSAVDADAVANALAHIKDEATASQIAGNFGAVTNITVVDARTVELTLANPAPALGAQMAAWLLPFPASATASIGTMPVGSGPYKLVEWTAGSQIVLEANADYPADSVKGQAIANRVVFRFVPEASTRVADLLSGAAHIVRAVTPDLEQAVVDGGAQIVTQPVSGIAIVRFATDVAPFDNPKVRQALNHAVDVQGIIDALLGGHGRRLSTIFPEGGIGFDPALAPMAYDPELAKTLLAEAGVTELKTQLQYAATERADIPEAIAGMLAEVGVEVELVPTELATFNGQWKDAAAPAMRFMTWKPMFDPFTFVSLVVSNAGFLSRYSGAEVQPLVEAAAVAIDPVERAALYQQVSAALQADPAGIYLYDLTAIYGVAAAVTAWTARADEYVLPMVQG